MRALVLAVLVLAGCTHDWDGVTLDGSAIDVATDDSHDASNDVTDVVADVEDVPADEPADEPCTACGANCTDTSRDPMNCGSCGNACSAPENAVATCSHGMCGFQCAMGFDRCGDRCFFTENNVSFCGQSCMDCIALPHTNSDTVNCSHGACTLLNGCASFWGDCDGIVSNGCETELTTQANCGACRLACSGATPRCIQTDSGAYSCVP
jgi:hypothetical protein